MVIAFVCFQFYSFIILISAAKEITIEEAIIQTLSVNILIIKIYIFYVTSLHITNCSHSDVNPYIHIHI